MAETCMEGIHYNSEQEDEMCIRDRDKTDNDNYYLLTLAALAQEIRKRKGEKTAKVVLAAGLDVYKRQLLWFLFNVISELFIHLLL